MSLGAGASESTWRASPNDVEEWEFTMSTPDRLLHTMLRVGDLQRSLDFYTDVLGMTLLRRDDFAEGRFTLAFVGYGNEREHSVIELTHNWDTDRYRHGNAFGHLAVESKTSMRPYRKPPRAAPMLYVRQDHSLESRLN